LLLGPGEVTTCLFPATCKMDTIYQTGADATPTYGIYCGMGLADATWYRQMPTPGQGQLSWTHSLLPCSPCEVYLVAWCNLLSLSMLSFITLTDRIQLGSLVEYMNSSNSDTGCTPFGGIIGGGAGGVVVFIILCALMVCRYCSGKRGSGGSGGTSRGWSPTDRPSRSEPPRTNRCVVRLPELFL
jgi:hypothetical protein